ncbi:DUF1996 domain-containing protein [Nonomuraea sp. NPDC050328]|uniref:DUF1996 domain-containing protein n=1 Tax=Nonomuraea sp. NPDC050328 TaxID=3364361 RepID=UPI0037A9F78D
MKHVLTALTLVASGLVAASVTEVAAAPAALADHCLPGSHSPAGGRLLPAPPEPPSPNPDPRPRPPSPDPDPRPRPPSPSPDRPTDPDRGNRPADPGPADGSADPGPGEPTGDPGEPTGDPGDDRGGDPDAGPSPSPSPSPTDDPGDECADLGPFPDDFIDIRRVQPNASGNLTGRGGSFTSRCGTNANGHQNPDNFIVAPGVRNGAHHLHDYVGNLSTDAFSTDQSLAAAGTTCRLNDRSTYFWPVLRDRRVDDNLGDPDGNVGRVLRPRQAIMLFRGTGERVGPMPRFLRLITGDAKAATNGGANARAQWTCTGFTNRITTKYPLCPRFSQVVRILDFPSCWDGQNTDSANHRTHVVFPQGGRCPQGTRAVPQLRMILTYSVAPGLSYALDAFPEQKHNPVTDHADFANVMPDRLMAFAVSCINRGRRC